MSQWGFYFNQSRCLGCKTCVLACKQWNEERRGDALIQNRTADDFIVAKPASDSDMVQEKGEAYIDSTTGTNNYKLYKEFYMKENWRRVETYETGYTRIVDTNAFEYNIDRRYLSLGCNHCTDPQCVKACPVSNIQKESEFGAVLRVSAENCLSCGRCKEACPWGAPQYYDEKFAEYPQSDPNRPRMTKCTLCIDRIREGLKPACVAACWNRALDAGPIDELKVKYPSAITTLPEFEDRKGSEIIPATNPNIIFKSK